MIYIDSTFLLCNSSFKLALRLSCSDPCFNLIPASCSRQTKSMQGPDVAISPKDGTGSTYQVVRSTFQLILGSAEVPMNPEADDVRGYSALKTQ